LRLATGSQRGAVLIVALVILLALTIIGVAGVQNTTMEERMAGNYRDRNSAFQAAEAALRAGEDAVGVFSVFETLDFDDPNSDKDGAYTVEKVTVSINPLYAGNYVDAASVSSLSGVSSTPLYFIEKVPKVPLPRSSLVVGFQSKPKDVQYYRISGLGTGPSGKAEVVLQTTYHR
jgi:type IV pilus assembly protein PilX